MLQAYAPLVSSRVEAALSWPVIHPQLLKCSSSPCPHVPDSRSWKCSCKWAGRAAKSLPRWYPGHTSPHYGTRQRRKLSIFLSHPEMEEWDLTSVFPLTWRQHHPLHAGMRAAVLGGMWFDTVQLGCNTSSGSSSCPCQRCCILVTLMLSARLCC